MIVLFGLQFSSRMTLKRALLSVSGIGRPYMLSLCGTFGCSPEILLGDVPREALKGIIRKTLQERTILVTLRREVITAIRLKSQLKLYQGIRHNEGLPVRGQNTKTNARTSRTLKRAKNYL
jgi:small subunit ribosomal protein S13